MSEPSPPKASTPRASVVIPSRNRSKAIGRCLEALARQETLDFEVLVVDDASTDDTPETVAAFAAANPEVPTRHLRQAVCRGANAARNRGVSEARAEIVAFLDDDCEPAPDWLDRLLTGFAGPKVASVTGGVLQAPARNVFEGAYGGAHRVHGKAGPAPRLVGCNMAVRKDLLERFGFDEDRARADGVTSVSGRGDEEGLYLLLRAAGLEQRLVPDAVVLHDHPLTGRSFLRQAWRGGRSAARLVYKFHLPPRLDMLPFLVALVALVPGLTLGLRGHRWGLWIPAGFAAVGAAAVAYNELFRKGKSPWALVVTAPAIAAYYALRVAGYVTEAMRLRLFGSRIERVDLNEAARTAFGSVTD